MSETARKRKNSSPVHNLRLTLQISILTAAAIFAVFPIIWVVSAALNPAQSMVTQSIIPPLPEVRVVYANAPGTLLQIASPNGTRVERSAELVLLVEVDGDEKELRAIKNGYVENIRLSVGDSFAEGDALYDISSSYFINFDTLLNTPRKPYLRWLVNSCIIASISAVIIVMITALSAYSFSRFRFQGRRSLLVLILLVQVFPNLLALVAIYLMLQQIGNHIPFLGLNTAGGLILVYIGGGMGINIWLMKGFFDSVPRDIDESALVDGASHWQVYWHLIFPLVRPVLVVVGILSFVGTYNEFVLARVMLRDKDTWTLMVGLWQYISANFAQDWGVFAAGAIIGALPSLAIYLMLQDQIVGGLTQGAVKG
ncbi:MAG: ABC transporter permease subunit [Chloroflexi bacterium]|nr:ABC transporter permease subunit [Chloroflexota bacterium]MCY3583434.1 ABC transporter permease subunit [Chloroflexota bacterium]MCY3715383.1 ABC transporter permease subunit [Chloroflexota bacterium]MDE2649592.1 ABC transporter permease subunit [Chloroflexota bacterium]